MTKKTPKQRKDNKEQLEIAKQRLKLSKELLEAQKEHNAIKLEKGFYKPGPAFETRMEYQSKDEFWEVSRRIDEIEAKFKLMQIEDQINHYSKEVSRLLGEVAERD